MHDPLCPRGRSPPPMGVRAAWPSNDVDRPFSAMTPGKNRDMRLRKVIKRQLRRNSGGVNVAGDVTAAISAAVNEPGATSTTVKSRTRIVQRDGRTEHFESQVEQEDEK